MDTTMDTNATETARRVTRFAVPVGAALVALTSAALFGWALGAGEPARGAAPFLVLVVMVTACTHDRHRIVSLEDRDYLAGLAADVLEENGPMELDPEGCVCPACTLAAYLDGIGGR